MTEDLGWTPVPTANLPWNDINQLILFNLATSNGPGLDAEQPLERQRPDLGRGRAFAPRRDGDHRDRRRGNDNWGHACSDANRAQFVQNLVGFATSNGFDGIDLDIEDGLWPH